MHRQRIAHDEPPTLLRGEVPVLITRRAVSPMIVSDHGKLVGDAGARKAIVAADMFAQPVKQLDNGLYLTVWRPGSNLDLVTVSGL